LAEAIKTILYLYAPEAILIGGSISKAYKYFQESLQANLKSFAYKKQIENLKIEVSTNQGSPILGAAALCLQEKISSYEKDIFITHRPDIYRCEYSSDATKIPITIENNIEGAPITMGIPFPEEALKSIDNVRLLNSQGKEIPVQTTEVTTWLPSSPSVKWAWIFFFQKNLQVIHLNLVLMFHPNYSLSVLFQRIT